VVTSLNNLALLYHAQGCQVGHLIHVISGADSGPNGRRFRSRVWSGRCGVDSSGARRVGRWGRTVYQHRLWRCSVRQTAKLSRPSVDLDPPHRETVRSVSGRGNALRQHWRLGECYFQASAWIRSASSRTALSKTSPSIHPSVAAREYRLRHKRIPFGWYIMAKLDEAAHRRDSLLSSFQ
jgi:hypothetical protein